MKFTINNVSYDTNNYLTSFVDENTGEVHPENKALNRSVRLLWFRSVYPQARIIKETVNSGMTIDVLKAMPEYNANIPDDVFKYYERLASRGCCTAIAKASIYLDSYAKEPAVVDYAVRYAEKGFSYNNEAALNAAADRAICSLGFIVPEEITVGNMQTVIPEGGNNADTPKQESVGSVINQIAQKVDKADYTSIDVEQLVDDSSDNDKSQPISTPKAPKENIQSNVAVYDIATPVDEIINSMSEEDARAYIIPTGKYANRTVGEVYEETKDKDDHSPTIGWFAEKYSGKNNILKAACIIVNR